MSKSVLTAALIRESCNCLDACMVTIRHCLSQLSEQQIWWRPAQEMNSIGNLILHLSGNLEQWIVSGLGKTKDTRNRPLEFSQQGGIQKQALLEQLQSVVDEAKQVLADIPESVLIERHRIQGFDVSGLGCIFDSLPHFKGHTQEIVCLTRIQLGTDYQFHWQPNTHQASD